MSSPSKTARTGFVLPFVLIAITAASIIAFAFTADGLQAIRAQHGVMYGSDAAAAADAALSQALRTYADDSVWYTPPGSTVSRTVRINGIDVVVEWHRRQPLVAALRARAHRTASRPTDAVNRDHLRAVWLSPPAIPVLAALATSGVVMGKEGTLVSGSDLVLPGSPCGNARDTMSVSGVAAAGVEPDAVGSWPGAPAWTPAPSTLLADLRNALSDLAERLPPIRVTNAPRSFPAARAWSALHWNGDTVVVTGPTRWTGLVTVRGALVLHGDVHITGLLVVEGSLDAAAARLSVQGAVVTADTSATGVMLGGESRLFYDRCAVQMALSTVARPTLAPFSLWHSLPR